MREPAASCHSCGELLQEDASILYSEQGDVVCLDCAPPVGRAADLLRDRAILRAARTRRRWRIGVSAVVVWILAGVFVAARVHELAPILTIDSPASKSSVPGRLRVTGRVALQTIRDPLWLFVGRQADGYGEDPRQIAIFLASDGSWEVPVELRGKRGTGFWLTVVSGGREVFHKMMKRTGQVSGCSQSRRADWHPGLGGTVLASIDVTLAEDNNPDSGRCRGPTASPE